MTTVQSTHNVSVTTYDDGTDIEHRITGSKANVEAYVKHLQTEFPPAAYGTTEQRHYEHEESYTAVVTRYKYNN